ncbi:MAG: hypothetical protein GYB33_00070 [Gammaproteobacteria bacterium]|nr:hypothetical protein [Gammaproteobacteria bacterium]
MTALDLHYTQPPAELIMPAMPQLVTTVIYGIGALVFVIYALRLCARHKSAMPVYFILGALLSIYFEPVVDLLGNAVHPQIGQYNIVTSNGHPVPWAVFVGYVWYFAAPLLLCYDQFKSQQLSPSFVWKVFAGVVVGAAIVEQIPLYFGTWVYYGYQSIKIGFIPVWWVFANTAAVLVPFLIIYKLFPVLKGWRQLLVIVLIPSGAFMGHSAVGWPMYNALGTNTETFPHWIIQCASLAAVGLSVIVVWVMLKMADVHAPE